ncbi:hypothetical protein V6N13_092677 [Hibiscus sabdariffa]
MLLKLGFAETWVSLVMSCVRTVSFFVSLNGTFGNQFTPFRGLRQGDPMSLFLFLICAEGLSVLLNDANREKSIRGATIGRERLEVGHLLFADDSILFGDETIRVATNMKNVLTVYGNASRQRVNFDKSLIFFSSNVAHDIREEIGSLLGVRVSSNPEKILGASNYGREDIWRARGLIEKNIGWRIGSGQNVNIWNEPWIHGAGDGRIGNQAININYMLVSGLIDASTKTWKLDVLNDLFDVEHVSKICTIPLSKLGMCDELIWRHDGSGSYTVKSGYRLLCEDVHIVYAKVKITMWKVINNFMPTFANLQSRRLNVNNSCAFCLSASESIDHIMRDCWFVRQVLETQGVQFPTPIVDVDWKDWLVLTFCSLSAKHKIVLMVTFWTTWYARNKVIHEGVVPSVCTTLSFIEAFIRENDEV